LSRVFGHAKLKRTRPADRVGDGRSSEGGIGRDIDMANVGARRASAYALTAAG
jgi:hypothetical protein